MTGPLLWAGIGCLVFAVSGCTTQPSTIERNESSRIRTIGVVSAFGDKLRILHAIPFWYRISDHTVPDWKIDEEAVSITRKVLGRTGTYQVVPIATDRVPRIDEAHRPTLFASTRYDVIGNELRALKLEPAIDAFIVLGAHRDDRGPWNERYLPIEGIGLYVGVLKQLSPLPGGTEPRDIPPDMQDEYGNRMLVPFAYYRISVIRATDFAPIGSRIAAMPRKNRRYFEFSSTSLPFKQIHSSVYKDEFQKFTDDDKRVIRQAITEALEASIPLTLKELGFALE